MVTITENCPKNEQQAYVDYLQVRIRNYIQHVFAKKKQ